MNLDTPQKISLVVLRVAIGWHFLYEGITKILNPTWTAYGYLMDSEGFLSGLFANMASNPGTMQIVDFMNIWGLTLIGLGLMSGFLTQVSVLAGILILLFYYLSHPALIGVNYAIPSEGNYLWINKTLIEMISLCVLYYFPTGRIIGIDRFFLKK
ncbi:MAG: DoxX family membrane protein [Bacteroidales bacterium]|nr:DoxX family membrane protein [Bacteroidales bacterium]